MKRSSMVVLLVLAFGPACIEPNPYAEAQDAGDGDGSTGDGSTGDGDGDPSTETGDPPGCGDPACSLGLELVEFSLQGGDGFSTEIPKPAQQTQTVPLAAVHRYDPGQSDNFGFALAWTDNGDSWTLDITVTGAAANSRISGVAAVIGLGDDFAPPEVHELTVSTADDGCGQLETAALAGRVHIDTVERYEPGDATVFEFSRTATIADTAAIEYCVTQPEALPASLGVKLVAFDLPEGALVQAAAATLDSATSGDQDFAALGDVAQIVHLIGAQGLLEAAEPGLGWAIDCAGSAPYACSYDLLGFKAGAAVEVGGAVLAIQ